MPSFLLEGTVKHMELTVDSENPDLNSSNRCFGGFFLLSNLIEGIVVC